ncbi:MAG: sigma-70 family RNA polymerase sigma factor [Nevskia sp.]|nr:sigma-70 family RNA polymerase sigma factor [Nevskia sp.]
MMQYRNGEMTAFEQLYRRHKDPLYRYLLRGCAHPESAAEMFQDVWAGLIKARAGYEPRARFSTWLYRMAHNRLVDHWRQAPRAPLPLEEELIPAAAEHERPEARVLAGEAAQRLRRALTALPVEQHEAFLLHQEAGLSLEEIAEVSGVGRETVKSRLRYGLAKLREALADD